MKASRDATPRPSVPRASRLSSLARFGFPLLVVVLTVLAFEPVLHAGLVNWDDPDTLTNNMSFRGLTREHVEWMSRTMWMGPYQPLAWLSFGIDHALWGFDSGASLLAHYHQTSVILHALAALALYFLALDLFWIARPSARSEMPNASRFAAFFAALVFAVHPLRVESVAWLTERRDVLSGFFFVLATWSWVRWAPRGKSACVDLRRRALALVAASSAVMFFLFSVGISADGLAWKRLGPWGLLLSVLASCVSVAASLAAARIDGRRTSWSMYSLALAAFFAALASKGLAMVLPAVLLVLDVWPLGRLRTAVTFARGAAEGSMRDTHDTRAPKDARAPKVTPTSEDARASAASAMLDLALEKAPFFALAAIFAVLAMWGQASIPGALVSWSDHTLGERLLQCCYGLVFYPLKTLLPLDLSPIYGLPDSLRVTQLRFALPVLAVIASVALLVRFRERVPMIAAALAAFAIAISPVLGMTQAGPQLVADRYSYIACLSFALAAGGALFLASSSTMRSAATAAALIVVALSIPATRAQSELWTDSAALWSRALELEPENALDHLNLALARIDEAARSPDAATKRARLADAQRLLERGLTLKQHALLYSAEARVHQVLWEMDPASSEHHEIAALDAMQHAVLRAKATGQYTPEYQLNLGTALFNAGKIDEAIVELASFLHDRPDSFLGRFNLGFALVRKARFDEAARELEYATRLDPSHVNAWGNLGYAYEALGDSARAIDAYRRVLALAPDHPTATAHLRELTKHDRR